MDCVFEEMVTSTSDGDGLGFLKKFPTHKLNDEIPKRNFKSKRIKRNSNPKPQT